MWRWLKNDYVKVYMFDMIAKGFSALISILIIRILTVNDYSEYTFFFSISSFLSGILGSGIGLAYTTYAVELRETNKQADALLFHEMIKKLLFIYPMLSLACFIVIVSFVGGNALTVFMGIFYGMLLSFNQIMIVFFQARKKYIVAGLVSNIKSILLSIILAVILLSKNCNIRAVYSVYVLTIAASMIVSYCLISRNIGRIELESVANHSLKNMLKDSIWTILYMFAISAFNQVDVMMLKIFTNDTAVANYGVAFKYYTLVISLLPAIQVVLRVNSSGSEMKDPKYRKNKVIQWTKKITPIAMLLMLVGIVGAKFLFPIINGKQYDSAIYAFDVLMLGAALSYITAPNVSIMVGARKQKVLFVLSAISFVTNVVGNYIFIPSGGIIAAATATIVAHFILNGGSTLYLLLDGKYVRK